MALLMQHEMRNMQYFDDAHEMQKNAPLLASKYTGKYVVFKDGKFVEAEDTLEGAFKLASRLYGPTAAFLIGLVVNYQTIVAFR